MKSNAMIYQFKRCFLVCTSVSLLSLVSTIYAEKKLPLNQLQMPPGFQIEIFADGVKDARKLVLGDKGTVFVGTSDAAKVYAIVPNKSSPYGYEVKVLASGLNQPQGVAFYQGNLYVAEVDRIIRYDDIEQHLDDPPPPYLVTNDFPIIKMDVEKGYPISHSTQKERRYQRHGWKSVRVGPDHKLYVTVGSPCNICLPKNTYEGTILRMNLNGTNIQVFAKGIRNSVGFDWDPKTHQLWFTDNGRDEMGDDIPPDKLNYAPTAGLDFGFPYYHGQGKNGEPIPDPKYGKLRSTEGLTWPVFNLPAHVAALGMIFYTGQMFPAEYKNQIIVAEHGSWNRSSKVGYRLSLIKVKDNKFLSYTPFISGWEKNEKYWGRPVDFLQLPDGSLLVSDDYAGVIYRISYSSSKN